jgi:hypothetical protein
MRRIRSATAVKGLLLGEAASPQVRNRLRDVIAGFEEVDVTGRDVELVCDHIERALHDAEPMVTEVFLDPTPRYDAARDRVRQGRQ